MNLRRPITVSAIALLALAIAQEPVTLKRSLKPGAKDVYKMESEGRSITDIPTMGEQEMTVKSTMLYTMVYGEARDGQYDVGASLTDLKVEFDGPMAQMMQPPEMPKEIKFKGKIDERNRLSDFKLDGKPDMMAMMLAGTNSMSSFLIEFPDKPVKPGDTWNVVVPKNPLIGSEEATLTAKLVGERDGKWLLTMAGEVKINGDLSDMMKGQDPTGTGMEMKVKVSGTMNLSNEALVDKTTGQTVELKSAMESNTVTDIENLGLKTTQKSKGTFKLTLQP